jgi:hypothetical protein
LFDRLVEPSPLDSSHVTKKKKVVAPYSMLNSFGYILNIMILWFLSPNARLELDRVQELKDAA